MIERVIPDDIRKYEAKAIGPFSLREAVCVGLGAVFGLVTYTALHDTIGQQPAVYATIIVGMFFAAFGYVKPAGITLEKFLQTVFVSFVLSPRIRKFEIHREGDYINLCTEDMSPLTAKEMRKRKKADKKFFQEHPENAFYK